MAGMHKKHSKGKHHGGTGHIKPMKHSGTGHHGPIRHSDMGSLMDGVGGKDPHADPAYLAQNSEHDMHEGMGVQGEYDGHDAPAGPGIADNEEIC